MNIPKFGYIKGTLYIDKETYDRDVMKVKEYKEDEIDRLNNIINELEKWLRKNINDINGYFENTPFGVEETYKEVLDKLKELKNGDKDE